VADNAAENAPENHDELMDVARLGAWMDQVGLPGAGAPIEHRYVSGGSQNEIFEIRRGDFHAALRRPPRIAPEGRNDGILREWRIIEALAGTDVPHTEAYAVCTDTSVLGCTFYLMGFVDGWSPVGVESWPAPFDTDSVARAGLAYQLVDGTARLSKVDWKAKGLSDLGRPDGFHERQVERWMRFYDRVKTRDVPGLEVTTDWLQQHKPIDFVPGIMHGDYQFANVMYRHGAPARLAAIIDWEMGTVGDPKLDLAWVVQAWPDSGGDAPASGFLDISGMPSRDALVQYFATEAGRQCDDIDYYVVLARWKLAIVLEQGYMRAMSGVGENEKLLAFGPIVLDLMRRAANLVESTDYGR
jgi:aminoglycoside phosphotransferase (APT) family kinase protein